MANQIDSSEISVVVQGVVDSKNTLICLKSIKEQLPRAEVILSTYNNTNKELLDKLDGLYDKLVLNDPQPVIYDNVYKHISPNHIFNQIISTQNGLKCATRKYAIKMRSDLKIVNTNFLNYFDKFDDIRREDIKIFNKHILCLSCFCNIPQLEKQFCFLINDWFNFGLTDDIKNFWNTNCYGDIEKAKKDIETDTFARRLHPEQYIFTDCLKRNGVNVDFYDRFSRTDENVIIHEKFFANNVVIIDDEQSGVFMQKEVRRYSMKNNQYCFNDWLLLYKKYCNSKQQTFDKNYHFLHQLSIQKQYIFKYAFMIKFALLGFNKCKTKRTLLTKITAPIRIIFFFLSCLYHLMHYLLLFCFIKLCGIDKKVEKQFNDILKLS